MSRDTARERNFEARAPVKANTYASDASMVAAPSTESIG